MWALLCSLALVSLFFPGCKRRQRVSNSYSLFKAPVQHYQQPHTHTMRDIVTTPTYGAPAIAAQDVIQPAVPPKATKKKGKNIKAEIAEKDEQELDFHVENKTADTIYVVCFSYIKKQDFTRWRWDKSKVYQVKPQEAVYIDVDSIPDEYDRKAVFGYLSVFNTRKEAQDSVYELLNDKYKIDLDLLYKLKGKTVRVGVEQYGVKGATLDYELHDAAEYSKEIPELDFVVENNTGKPVYIAAFVYQHKGSTTIWRFDKTPVQRIEPGKQVLIDVDTISKRYERIYLRGYLGVFPEHDEQKAHESTYELLAPENKVKLGALFALGGKKVVLQVEQYGLLGDMIDYTIKPIRKIKFGRGIQHVSDQARIRAWR